MGDSGNSLPVLPPIGLFDGVCAKATLNVWRSPLVGTAPTFAITFQESTDQVTWTACAVAGTPFPDPGADSETQYTVTLTKRWFRVKVTLGGTSPVATCWCVGFFEERES